MNKKDRQKLALLEKYDGTWRKTHGLSTSQLYHIYWGIIMRCENPKDPSYSRYGACGIKMCKEWRENFVLFAQWSFENGYYEKRNSKNMNKCTLDRINPNMGYCPENCRWVDKHTQSANRRYKKNSSGYTGVYWTQKNKKYRAMIKVNGKSIFIALKDTPYEAHIARVLFIKEKELKEYPEYNEVVL